MIRRLLLSVVSLLVLCVALEFVLRTTHLFNARLAWTEPDREIGWRFTPGREYWFNAENDHPITGRINSLGWRDRERDAWKDPGVTRIAVIGDSYVEAFQVELDSTFVAIGEDRLNRGRGSSHRREVMNFGRSGMSPAEELIVLERDVMQYDPSFVLLLFTPQNDIADVNPATTTVPCRPFFHRAAADSLILDTSFVRRRDFRIREIINPLKQHSALVSLVTERYAVWQQSRAQARMAPRDETKLTREQRMCTANPDSVYAQNYALCKALIARMAFVCAKNKVAFTVAAVPLAYRGEDVERLKGLDASFDPLFFDRDLQAMADSSGFYFRPMTEAFASRAGAAGNFHWRHWNYTGHRIAAYLLLWRRGE